MDKFGLIKYSLKTFDSLNLKELYDLLALRQEIFIVEQDCPYLDADGIDQKSHHLLGYDQYTLATYVRLVPKGISYENYCSIGRVVVKEAYRRSGLGYELMTKAIDESQRIFPNQKIKISAQSHLEKFYGNLGFIPTGEEYLEDGIPHIGMTLSK